MVIVIIDMPPIVPSSFTRIYTRTASQTPGRIQKADPLMGVPIKYP